MSATNPAKYLACFLHYKEVILQDTAPFQKADQDPDIPYVVLILQYTLAHDRSAAGSSFVNVDSCLIQVSPFGEESLFIDG